MTSRWAGVRNWSRGRFRLWAPPGMPGIWENPTRYGFYWDDMIQPDGMIKPVEPSREGH
jgi:hypothetical protein